MIISSCIYIVLPVGLPFVPPDISKIISPSSNFLFLKLPSFINLIGISALLPFSKSGKSAPLIQKIFCVCLISLFSFPHSPLIVKSRISSIGFTSHPVYHPKLTFNHFSAAGFIWFPFSLGNSKSTNQCLNIAWAISSRALLILLLTSIFRPMSKGCLLLSLVLQEGVTRL